MTLPADCLNEVICPCSGTTRQQILRVLERGETTLEEVSQATGASPRGLIGDPVNIGHHDISLPHTETAKT